MTATFLANKTDSLVYRSARKSAILASAASVSLVVFYLMSKLVAPSSMGEYRHVDYVPVELQSPRAEKPPIVKTTLPEKPQPPVQPPPTKLDFSAAEGTADVFTPSIQAPVIAIGGAATDIGPPPEQDASPVVRMEPKYPMEAARNGLEGWVELSFSIDTTGQVTDVKVIQSEPRRVFDQAAMQALKRWKYRPKVIDGQAIVQSGLAVRLDFNLDNQ